jgi:hypothetical protein
VHGLQEETRRDALAQIKASQDDEPVSETSSFSALELTKSANWRSRVCDRAPLPLLALRR